MKTRRTRCRATKTLIVVGSAETLGVDGGGYRYVTMCEEHGTVCAHPTSTLARQQASWPEWCKDCQALLEKRIKK